MKPPSTAQIVIIPVCYEKGLRTFEYIDFGNKSPKEVVTIKNNLLPQI